MSTGRALTRTCVPDKWSDEYRNLLKKLIEIIELMNLSSEIHDAFADVMLSTGGAAMQLFVNMKESMRLEYVKMQIAYSCWIDCCNTQLCVLWFWWLLQQLEKREEKTLLYLYFVVI